MSEVPAFILYSFHHLKYALYVKSYHPTVINGVKRLDLSFRDLESKPDGFHAFVSYSFRHLTHALNVKSYHKSIINGVHHERLIIRYVEQTWWPSHLRFISSLDKKGIPPIVQRLNTQLPRLTDRHLFNSSLPARTILMGAVLGVVYCVAWVAGLVATITGHNQRMAEREKEAQQNAEARKRVCYISRLPDIATNAASSNSSTKLKRNISTRKAASILPLSERLLPENHPL